MNKILISVLLCFAALADVQACDICGGAMGGGMNGIYPQFTRNIIGLNYKLNQFDHPNTLDNFNGSSQVLSDQFQTIELWGRFYAHPRVQILGYVPFQVNNRTETERETEISGIGDMSVTVNYSIVNTADSLNKKVKHMLLVGVGATLPTGKYQARDETKAIMPADFQIGSGAYSLSPNLNYTVRTNGWGLNLAGQYSFLGENELQYNYGDQWSGNASVFYWYQKGNWSLVPNVGIGYEKDEVDYQYDVEKPVTGGSLKKLTGGVDVNVNRLFFRFYCEQPFDQDIPAAQPEGGFRWNVGLSLVL